MVQFIDSDAGSHGHGAVEIFLQVVTDHAIRAAARANAPVMKQGNAPNIVADFRGRNIFPPFADDDGDFAFIIEIGDALGNWNPIARPRDFGRHFPESPLARLLRFLGNLLHADVGLAEPIGPHARKMSRVVAAYAGDAPFRSGRVELDVSGVVNEFVFAAFVGRYVAGLLDHSLGFFQRGRTA